MRQDRTLEQENSRSRLHATASLVKLIFFTDFRLFNSTKIQFLTKMLPINRNRNDERLKVPYLEHKRLSSICQAFRRTRSPHRISTALTGVMTPVYDFIEALIYFSFTKIYVLGHLHSTLIKNGLVKSSFRLR